jgi:alpha-methylacyl-CoA racemase
MERLGLGPDQCLARNPRLVYGRMTGWGQQGPLAQAAGHDLNYIALSGALWFSGEAGQPPMAPPTLVGDLGGGALYLAMGILAGIINAGTNGVGQVVDAAIVDGSANLMNLLLIGCTPPANSRWSAVAACSTARTGARTYACADGLFVSVQALEPQFNALLFSKLGLGDDPDFKNPYEPRLVERLARAPGRRVRQPAASALGRTACKAATPASPRCSRQPKR